MKLKILKSIDKVVGKFLVGCLPAAPGWADDGSGGIERLLVIRPGGIGDAVLLVPLIQALRSKFPDAHIDILAEKRNAGFFELVSEVDSVYLYDSPLQFVKVLQGRYDIVIDTEQWHRLSAVISRLVRAGRRIGFATNERSRLFSDGVEYSHHQYEADSFLSLLRPLGIEWGIRYPFLQVPESSLARREDLLSGAVGEGYVLIFPGASIPERQWGGSRYAELASQLEEDGRNVVVIGGQGDRLAGDEIISGIQGGVNLAGRCSLVETAAVLSGASLLVSGDSGILHIAVGLGLPTVSLFGAGIVEKWAPRGNKHIVINKKLDCSPCTKFGYTPHCSIGVACLSEISVEEVYRAALKLLKEERKR